MSLQKRLKTIRLFLRVSSIVVVGLMPGITYALPEPPLTEGQLARRQIEERYGELKYTTQVDAAADCKSKGARLPSIRELAELTKSHGGRVLEPENKCDPSSLPGCSEERVRNEDGRIETFYFDRSQLYPPDLWMELWSSSTGLNNPDDFLTLDMNLGMILDAGSEARKWFFCVADPVVLLGNSDSFTQK